jgi:hypothetical protein
MSWMVAFFLIATIAGMLLALYFKVVVLLPATLLAAVAVLASGHQPEITMTLTLLGTAALLQIGYFVGLSVRGHLRSRTMALSGVSFSTPIVRSSPAGRLARRKSQQGLRQKNTISSTST